MASKQDCIEAAVRGGSSRSEAEEIVELLAAEKSKLQIKGVTTGLEKEMAKAVSTLFEKERVANIQARRQANLNVINRTQIDEFIASATSEGADFGDSIVALLVGSMQRYAGARDSVARKRFGLIGQWMGGLVRELDELDAIPLLKKNKAFGEIVMRDMMEPGTTGDAKAQKVGEVFTKYLENARVCMNEKGANIGKLDNYTPQSHDENLLLKAGVSKWANAIYDKLDWERSFPGVTERNARLELLDKVYKHITTGISEKPTQAEMGNTFMSPRNLARGFEQSRVLHFTNADAVIAYHQEYGKGTIINAVLGQLDRATGKLALMDTFGPNPEAMLKAVLADRKRSLFNATREEVAPMIHGKTKKRLMELEAARQAASDAGDIAGVADITAQWESMVDTFRTKEMGKIDSLWSGHRDGKIAHYYSALSGELGTPANLTAAKISANIRGGLSMAKLGGVLLSSFSDVFVKAISLRHNGENFFSMWKNAFDMRVEVLQTKEKKQLGRYLGVYMNSLVNDLQSRFDIADAQSGWMTRSMNLFFKLSGLEDWTEGHKAAYTFYLSSRLGDNRKVQFQNLQKDYAASLRRHGLDTRWDLIRSMATKEADGNTHILPENAYKLSDESLENFMPDFLKQDKMPTTAEGQEVWEAARQQKMKTLRQDLATDIMGYYSDETKFAVLEPDAKTRGAMYGSTQGGTLDGELRRFMLQFKSFSFSYSQRFLGDMRWQRASNERNFSEDIPGMIHAATAAMLFGYLAGVAKDVSKGREPRSPMKLETWMAAAMQSGGLGIMGDFFMGTKDRFGSQAASNVLGSGLTAASQIMPITGQLVRGEWKDAGEDALRWGLNNTPFLNLWYTRYAMDYLFLFHIREILSPGTLARSERKAKEEYNQKYLKLGDVDLTPSKHIKRGGGFR